MLSNFFFLMIRPPPRSSLFPYTPLFRSTVTGTATNPPGVSAIEPGTSIDTPADCARSQEHTSELQSQSNIVCRLLIEKIIFLASDANTFMTVTTLFLDGGHSPMG